MKVSSCFINSLQIVGQQNSGEPIKKKKKKVKKTPQKPEPNQ